MKHNLFYCEVGLDAFIIAVAVVALYFVAFYLFHIFYANVYNFGTEIWALGWVGICIMVISSFVGIMVAIADMYERIVDKVNGCYAD